MTNYYDILGLQPGASANDIKVAFRRLAMVYHPDKNPGGEDYFAIILKAYETLSDPVSRTTYDYRLEYKLSQRETAPKRPTTKNWSFDEKEMKRRRYYDEHIKKYAKSTPAPEPAAKPKSSYNEFKYILFATPLAVALFLLVVNLASPQQPDVALVTPKTEAAKEEIVSDLRNGDAPYTYHFGTGRFDTLHDKTLTVKNLTGADVIVCLFSRSDFVRSFYVKSDYSAEVSQLPLTPLHIRYSSGLGFSKTRMLKEAQLYGAFTKHLSFYKSIKPSSLTVSNELTLLPGINEGFESTGETDFFKKAY